VKPNPPRVGPVTLTVRLPEAGADVTLEADMSHAGMNPIFAHAQETAPGVYQAHLDLAMAGDWVVLIQGKLRNGQELERQADLKGVLPN
jgi:hypothetical protein